jgi:5-methyltetrahydropteroyltriglutamate--homocysteine methyltransferase
MSLAEMLEVVEDKASFEQMLSTLDMPAYSVHNPTCIGRISRREPLALNEYQFLRKHTKRPIKVPLPGPYILTRAMWVKELSRGVYPSKEDLAEDVVKVLIEEVRELEAAGVDFIQFDEPVLTELVFNSGQTRTFMCASLAARQDSSEELEFAVGLINRVLEGVQDMRTGVHICRGNWSQNEKTLLSGSYHPLVPYLARLKTSQLVLEYATPRAGELAALLSHPEISKIKELGLGVVNPRTPEVESVEEIVIRVEEALQFLSPEQIFLNPDCGFGSFSSSPMNSVAIAREKLTAMVNAAEKLRS